MGFYLVIFKKSLSTKNQDIKYNHLITNIFQLKGKVSRNILT